MMSKEIVMENRNYRIHIRQGQFELDVEGDREFVESYVEGFLSGDSSMEELFEDFSDEPYEDETFPSREAPAKESAKARGRRGRKPGPKAQAKTKLKGNTQEMDKSKRNAKGQPAANKGAKGKRAVKAAPPEPVTIDKSALKAFMKGLKKLSNKERYRQYMRFLHGQGVADIDDAAVTACFAAEGLTTPPTGRQNFSTLRNEGKVKRGSSRGYWALTPLGMAGSSEGEKEGRKARPKAGTKAGPKAGTKVKSRPKSKGRAKAKTLKAGSAKSGGAAKKGPAKKGTAKKTRAKVTSKKTAPTETVRPAPKEKIKPGRSKKVQAAAPPAEPSGEIAEG